jgi:hypothetical protein
MQPDNQPQGGALPQTPGQGPAPEASPQPAYVTAEQFQQALNDLKGEISKNYQGVQSQVDRQKNWIAERLNQTVETLNKGGIQVTEAQKQQITQGLILEAFTQPGNPPAPQPGQATPATPAQPQGQPDQNAQIVAWAETQADRMEQKLGVRLDENDPEFAQFVKPVQEADDPMDFLYGYRQALDAKKARVASTPTARMPAAPGMGAAPQGQFTTNLDQIWAEAKRK